MLVLLIYTLQKFCSLWYWRDFMTYKIFQSVTCLRPTFKDLSLRVTPEEVINLLRNVYLRLSAGTVE